MNDYIKNLEASQMKESVDKFNVGDTVKVHNRIKEGNKERIQIFEGTVIKRQDFATANISERYLKSTSM